MGPVRKLIQGTRSVYSCGAGHLSTINEDGSAVEDSVPPFEVRLVPNPEIFEIFGYQEDDEMPLDYLMRFDEPTGDVPFYEVWANADPDAEFVHIGDIHTTTPFTTSLFADERLFFQHERMTNDYTRLIDAGETARADAWRNWVNQRAGRLQPAWDNAVDGVPGLVAGYDDWEEMILDGLEGDLNTTETCPFAWIFV